MLAVIAGIATFGWFVAGMFHRHRNFQYHLKMSLQLMFGIFITCLFAQWGI